MKEIETKNLRQFGITLGIIMKVTLVLVYYVILTPIGLLMRLFRRDPLGRKIKRNAKTYWIKRQSAVATRESFERQF